MNKTDFNLFQYCCENIKPKENLDNKIFNFEYLMPKTIRQKFFKLIHIYMENSVHINEAKVKDIILTGRRAGFYYQNNSPYELWIIIDLSNVPCLANRIDAHRKYLWMMKNFVSSNFKFIYENCSVTIKSALEIPKNCGAFSILQNKWLNKPEMDMSLSAEELWNDYFQINGDFYCFIKKIISRDSSNEHTEYQDMLLYLDGLTQLKSSIHGLLLYSLLEDSGRLEQMEKEISQYYCSFLSL